MVLAATESARIDHGFANDATIREKYDVEKSGAESHVTAEYKENAAGSGWTSRAYLKMRELHAVVGGGVTHRRGA